MTCRLAFSLLAAASLAACGSGNKANDAQAKTETGAANTSAPAESGSAELSAAWLAGRWQSEGAGDCGGASDSYLAFEPDGRYSFMEESGRWTLEGDRLTIEITNAAPDGEAKAGDRSTTQIKAVSADEAELTVPGQPPSRIHRCRG